VRLEEAGVVERLNGRVRRPPGPRGRPPKTQPERRGTTPRSHERPQNTLETAVAQCEVPFCASEYFSEGKCHCPPRYWRGKYVGTFATVKPWLGLGISRRTWYRRRDRERRLLDLSHRLQRASPHRPQCEPLWSPEDLAAGSIDDGAPTSSAEPGARPIIAGHG
jgi:hypothetical protein